MSDWNDWDHLEYEARMLGLRAEIAELEASHYKALAKSYARQILLAQVLAMLLAAWKILSMWLF